MAEKILKSGTAKVIALTVPKMKHFGFSPAGIWCQNDVVLTSMRRDDVASTLIRRHFHTKCPLGRISVRSGEAGRMITNGRVKWS